MSSLKLKIDSSSNVTSTLISSERKAYEGRIEIRGRINLKQFYYLGGKSDADTVKITMQVNAIRFRKNDKSEWQDNLNLFKNAKVGGKKVIDSQGRMTIRLQGIRCP